MISWPISKNAPSEAWVASNPATFHGLLLNWAAWPAVIAAMAITSEYSTGMIRTSLTAQPRRGTIYAAKAIVLTSLTLIVSLVTSFIAFFVGQALLSTSDVSASLFHSVKIPQNANVVCLQQGAGGGVGAYLFRKRDA